MQTLLPIQAERKSAAIAHWANGRPLENPLPPGTILCGEYSTREVIQCLPNSKTACGREGTTIVTKIHRADIQTEWRQTIPFVRACGPILRSPTGEALCPMSPSGTPLFAGWSPTNQTTPFWEKESRHHQEIFPTFQSETHILDQDHHIHEKRNLSQNPLETHQGKQKELQKQVRALILKEEAQIVEETILEASTAHAKIIVRTIQRLGHTCQKLAKEENFQELARKRTILSNLIPNQMEVPSHAVPHLEDNPQTACLTTLELTQEAQKEIIFHQEESLVVAINPRGHVEIQSKNPENPKPTIQLPWKRWDEKKGEILENYKEAPKKTPKPKKSSQKKRDSGQDAIQTPQQEIPAPEEGVLCVEVAPNTFATQIKGFEDYSGMYGAVSPTGYHSQVSCPQQKWKDLQRTMEEKSRERKSRKNPISQMCQEAVEIAGQFNLLNLIEALEPNPNQECYTAYHAAHAALAELKTTRTYLFLKKQTKEQNRNESLLDVLTSDGVLPHSPAARKESIQWLIRRKLTKLGKNLRLSQEMEGIQITLQPIDKWVTNHTRQWDDPPEKHGPSPVDIHLMGTITAHTKGEEKSITLPSNQIAQAARCRKTLRKILEDKDILEPETVAEIPPPETSQETLCPQLELF
jgi:hypothetical protein